jgi:hypothetical protein
MLVKEVVLVEVHRIIIIVETQSLLLPGHLIPAGAVVVGVLPGEDTLLVLLVIFPCV